MWIHTPSHNSESQNLANKTKDLESFIVAYNFTNDPLVDEFRHWINYCGERNIHGTPAKQYVLERFAKALDKLTTYSIQPKLSDFKDADGKFYFIYSAQTGDFARVQKSLDIDVRNAINKELTSWHPETIGLFAVHNHIAKELGALLSEYVPEDEKHIYVELIQKLAQLKEYGNTYVWKDTGLVKEMTRMVDKRILELKKQDLWHEEMKLNWSSNVLS